MSNIDIIPSGFPSLDQAIGGGFRLGELVVLGGDAGSGTSSLSLAIALNASASGSLFLTSEMSSDRVAERALAIEARVALSDIRQATLNDDAQESVAAAAQRLRFQSPIIKPINHLGVAAITQAIAEHPDARLLVVDGLESLLTTIDGRDDQLAFALLSLKRLAIAARVVVLLVAHLPQFDDQRHDRRPRLSDFGVHGAAAVHADIVFGLYREEIYLPELSLQGQAELILLKWRDGSPGYVDLFFVAESLRFEDVLDGGALPELGLGEARLDDGIMADGTRYDDLLETED